MMPMTGSAFCCCSRQRARTAFVLAGCAIFSQTKPLALVPPDRLAFPGRQRCVHDARAGMAGSTSTSVSLAFRGRVPQGGADRPQRDWLARLAARASKVWTAAQARGLEPGEAGWWCCARRGPAYRPEGHHGDRCILRLTVLRQAALASHLPPSDIDASATQEPLLKLLAERLRDLRGRPSWVPVDPVAGADAADRAATTKSTH